MKQRIFIEAVMDNGTSRATSLEVSCRQINQKDLNRFCDKISTTVNSGTIRKISIRLSIKAGHKEIFTESSYAYDMAQLNKLVTDYGMIADYIFYYYIVFHPWKKRV